MSNDIIRLDKSDMIDIRQMNPAQLRAHAEKKSAEILELINKASRKVTQAKRASEAASKMKAGGIFGGKTKLKTNATADALMQTNRAVAELAKLQQEAIHYTCMSIGFARVMHETMAKMMASGFKDAHGCIQAVDAEAQDFARHILDEAEAFTKNQEDVEERQAIMDKKLSDISQREMEDRQRLDDKEKIDAAQQRDIDKIKADIATIRAVIEADRDVNKAQNQELQRLAFKSIDNDALIARLFQEAKVYDNRLAKEEMAVASVSVHKMRSISALLISMLALIISIMVAFGIFD